MQKLITLVIFFLMMQPAFSQLGEAKSKARQYKSEKQSRSKSSRRSSESSSVGYDDEEQEEEFDIEGCFFMFELTFQLFKYTGLGLYEALIHPQELQMSRQYDDPWIVSANFDLSGGFDPSDFSYGGGFYFTPSIKGNLGYYSSELRVSKLFDPTGTITTIDWQILQFNLVNLEITRLYFGLGLSHMQDVDLDMFEKVIGLDVKFPDTRLTRWSTQIRWSDNGVPRTEFSTDLRFKILEKSAGNLELLGGIRHLTTFHEKFTFLQSGLSFRLD